MKCSERYAHREDRWSPMPEMNVSKHSLSAASLGGRLFIIGYEHRGVVDVEEFWQNCLIRLRIDGKSPRLLQTWNILPLSPGFQTSPHVVSNKESFSGFKSSNSHHLQTIVMYHHMRLPSYNVWLVFATDLVLLSPNHATAMCLCAFPRQMFPYDI